MITPLFWWRHERDLAALGAGHPLTELLDKALGVPGGVHKREEEPRPGGARALDSCGSRRHAIPAGKRLPISDWLHPAPALAVSHWATCARVRYNV